MRNHSILIALILLYSSCGINYMPSPSASPLINKRGETIAMGNLDISAYTVGTSFTAATSPFKNIALSYNHFRNYNQNQLIFNSSFDEVFIGVYKNINENYFLDLYLGYGKGKNHSEIDTSRSNWLFKRYANFYYRYETYSINPSFCYKTDILEYSFGIKLSQLSIYDLYLREMMGSILYTSYDKIDNQKYIFIQPSFKVKYGLKNLKLCSQLTYNKNLSDNNFVYNRITLSVGIQYQFNFLKL